MAPRRPEQHAAYERRLWERLSQRLRAVIFALVLSLALAGNDAHAQSSSEGAVHGVVGAIAGSAVPAFTVTLRNLDNGTEQASLGTRLGTRGSFLLSPLEPGRYELTVAASGFRPVRAPAFDVEAEQTVEINVTLRSGAAGSEIILQRAADHAEQAAEESLMPDENDDGLSSVHGLPAMETRSLLDGASHDQNFGAVPAGSGSDPVTDVDDDPDSAELSTGPSHGLGRGRRAGAAYSVSPVAVREFRVREGNYSAATSAGSAGESVIVSRGGGSSLHGSFLFNLRSSGTAARESDAVATSYQDGVITRAIVKPHDLRTNFAGSAGGAVPRLRRTFLFYALDVQRRNFPAISSPAAPNFYRLTTIQMALLGNRQVTRAGTNAALNYVSSLTGQTPRRADQTIHFARLDWQQHPRAELSLAYNRVRYTSPAGLVTAPTVARGRASLGTAEGSLDSLTARVSSRFGARAVNEALIQGARDLQFELAQPNLPGEPQIGPGGLSPEVNIGPDGLLFGTPATIARKAYPDERRLEFSDTFSYQRGHHAVSVGGSVAAVNEHVATLANAAGTFHYDSGETRGFAGGLVDFITDYTYNVNTIPNGACPTLTATNHFFCFRTFTQSFGEENVSFSTVDWTGFAEDTWRPRSRLTVHFGARYEYTLLPLPQKPNAALDGIFGALPGGAGATSVFPEDRNNVGPRAALSYRLGGSTTVRMGYGLFFGRLPGATIRSALADTAQAASTTRIRITPTAVTGCPQTPMQGFGYPCSFLTQPAGLVAQTTSAMVFDRRFRLPVVQQGSLSVERELGSKTTLTAGYVMNLDRQLPSSTDLNIAPSSSTRHFVLQGGTGAPGVRDGESFDLPVYTARITPAFGPVTDILSSANATYHALEVGFESRAIPSLQLRAQGAWSKAIDFAPSLSAIPRTNSRLDPFTSGYDKGLSSLNYPWALRADAVWRPELHRSSEWLRRVANGWEVASLATVRSGRPYSLDLFGGTRLPGGHASLNGSGGALYLPTVGRNTLRLPLVAKVDGRITRSFRISSRGRMVAAAEAFNVLNSRNVSSVSQRAYHVGSTVAGTTPLVFQDAAAVAAQGLNTPAFGTPTASSTTLTRARRIAFSVRLEF